MQTLVKNRSLVTFMHACIGVHVGKYSHTVTFSPEDKRSVICGDLKLQLPDASHISDKSRRDEALRIYVLQRNTNRQLLRNKFK